MSRHEASQSNTTRIREYQAFRAFTESDLDVLPGFGKHRATTPKES